MSVNHFSIVEKELARKKLYLSIVSDLNDFLGWDRLESSSNLLLRLVFSEAWYKSTKDWYRNTKDSYQNIRSDPIFDEQFCEETIQGIKEDLDYKLHYKVSKQVDEVKEWLTKRFIQAREEVEKVDQKDDIVIPKGEKLIYKNEIMDDINDLSKDFPDQLNYVFAVNIRYVYMGIARHGASRAYKSMGFDKSVSDNERKFDKGDAIECFANPLNRYFDHYCSAFPDIELPLGSLGSFNDPQVRDKISKLGISQLFLNPPLSVPIIKDTYEYVLNLESNKTCTSTMPGWSDIHDQFTDRLKSHPGFKFFTVHQPGKIAFINKFHVKTKNKLRYNQNKVVEWQVKT